MAATRDAPTSFLAAAAIGSRIKQMASKYVPLSLGLACALAAAPVMAAPTVSTLGGDTQVTLSSTLLGALDSLDVAPSVSYPAQLRVVRSGARASFPIPTGEIDLGTARGEIVHNGGLNLTAGSTTVNLSSFVVDTTGDDPVLTGLVKANDSLVGRITLFDLALGSAPSVRDGFLLDNLRVDNVTLTLSADAAVALNEAFGVTAFEEGLPVGTARVNTYFFDPDGN